MSPPRPRETLRPRPQPYSHAPRVGLPALVVAAVGAVLVLLAFTVLDWFRSGSDSQFFRDGSDSTFGDLRDGFDAFRTRLDAATPSAGRDVHFGIADSYFGWLGWLLFAVAVCVAVAAALPSRAAPVLRATGLVVGLVAAGLTVWALQLVTFSGRLAQLAVGAPTFWGYVKHSGVGAWLAIAGFVLLGIGAAIGPRRTID